MPTSTEAEENLRVIRSLMEKATIYRAVSAPTALMGAIFALIVSSPPVRQLFSGMEPTLSFRVRWLLALAVTLLVNTCLIWREANRRGDPMVSPGMRAAIRSLLPPLLCGGLFFFGVESHGFIPAYLCLFYGLGLLATAHFAPKSIFWLGWAFLLAGIGSSIMDSMGNYPGTTVPDLVMAITFGGFHLIYAACTWPRAARSEVLSDVRLR